MNRSDCVHWLYAVRTGTSTSTDFMLPARSIGSLGFFHRDPDAGHSLVEPALLVRAVLRIVLKVRVGTNGANVELWVGAHRVATTRRLGMPSWLILIIIGVVLVILGVATEIGQFLIWIGVAVLVISLIVGLARRTRT
ncbi:hypothetical protein [Promicromonospora sp. NPDC050262]|uniref:hypothetical protein n=1 Tax=Promicromonospora sp. NPDC050262 TaxID=3155036 RepID=UPI0033D2D4CD